MTIQPSILVWTVICFCLLMLILNNLLFKPMLAFMDKRKEKIDAAQKRKAEIEKSEQEYAENLAARHEQFLLNEAKRADEAVNSAIKKADEREKAAECEKEKRIELAKTDVEIEKSELSEKLDKSVEELAQAFVTRIVS